jgi:hypothetical protein
MQGIFVHSPFPCFINLQISVFFTTRMDGVMEVWDFLFQHRVPVCPLRVADYPLHAIKVPFTLYYTVFMSCKQHLLLSHLQSKLGTIGKYSIDRHCRLFDTLIKKKAKFSSYIRKFRWDRLQSHI